MRAPRPRSTLFPYTTLFRSQDQWDAIEEKGVLKVATSGTLYPSSYHEEDTNKLTGYEVEIIREIADRLDLEVELDRKSTRLNSSHVSISYAVFCLKKKTITE